MYLPGRSFVRTAARLCALAGLAAVPLLAAGPAVLAAYPGSNGLIALVRSGNIYTVTAGGTGLAQLTAGGGSSGPRWSPNGKLIAYIHDGNLWQMQAGGQHQTQLTDQAPAVTDSRPSWSPSGRYLAFVATQSGQATGILSRYDRTTSTLTAFTTNISGELIQVTAMPAGVAWNKASNGYPILYQGAGELCQAGFYCLDVLGLGRQSQTANGFPSSEDSLPIPDKLTDPDWYPADPDFASGLVASLSNCSGGTCTPTGIVLPSGFAGGTSPPPTVLPGGYSAVFSPSGTQLAFVQKTGGQPAVYTASYSSTGPPTGVTKVTTGNQPDWQPTAG